MNAAELAAFRAAFTNEKVDSLITALEEVLPERKAAGKSSKMDVRSDITGTVSGGLQKKGGIVIGKCWVVCVLFLIAAVMVSGCLGSRTPPYHVLRCLSVLVDYYRTGGIAGLQDRLVIFDNGVAIVSSRTVNQEIESEPDGY